LWNTEEPVGWERVSRKEWEKFLGPRTEFLGFLRLEVVYHLTTDGNTKGE
jgi:hypothetical protein